MSADDILKSPLRILIFVFAEMSLFLVSVHVGNLVFQSVIIPPHRISIYLGILRRGPGRIANRNPGFFAKMSDGTHWKRRANRRPKNEPYHRQGMDVYDLI